MVRLHEFPSLSFYCASQEFFGSLVFMSLFGLEVAPRIFVPVHFGCKCDGALWAVLGLLILEGTRYIVLLTFWELHFSTL